MGRQREEEEEESEELTRFKRRGSILKGRDGSKGKGVCGETVLVTTLAVRLVQVFGVGYVWIGKLVRMLLFVACLLPGFLRISIQYVSSKRIRRNIPYASHGRSLLDVYLAAEGSEEKCPVVVFVSGGAWIIGYKAWGALMGSVLAAHGIVCVTPDYRNFPQGTISDMVKDVSQAMEWIKENIAMFGGDPDRIYLVGQSAGAHISLLALLRRAREQRTPGHRKQEEGEAKRERKAFNLRGWIGISGPYNIEALAPTFNKHGLYKRILLEIMEGDFFKVSPSKILRHEQDPEIVRAFPPIFLFHGNADECVSDASSFELAFVLSQLGADVTPVVYSGKTHTDPIVEDPMRGTDQLLEDIIMIVKGEREPPRITRYLPDFLIDLGRIFNPF